MTTINLYDSTIADHSNDDAGALEWAGSGVLADIETSEQDLNTNAWREVGTVDGDTITVWHDGCESYFFEALECEPSEAIDRSDVIDVTPEDFEPEITLAAGDVVVRMQYRDGGGLDRRGDYRYEITADGKTCYGDDLQSPRMGFDHAADSVYAFRAMACSMLSFATTDDESAEYRAPESMQDALENANCTVSHSEDGSDDPGGWTVVDSSDWNDKWRAFAAWWHSTGRDITDLADAMVEVSGDEEIELDGESWRVLTDSEATQAANDYIWESVWAFNTSFLADHMVGGHDVAKSTESFRADKCEDANPATQALIGAGSGKDHFCAEAIQADGRGHFLAGYDNEEHEFEFDGETHYFYRTN